MKRITYNPVCASTLPLRLCCVVSAVVRDAWRRSGSVVVARRFLASEGLSTPSEPDKVIAPVGVVSIASSRGRFAGLLIVPATPAPAIQPLRTTIDDDWASNAVLIAIARIDLLLRS